MAGYLGNKAVLLSTTAATVSGDATISGDLTVDTDTLYVDSTNNRVGVGTSSPAQKLHVSGTGSVSSRTYATDSGGDASFYAGNDNGQIVGPLVYGSGKAAYGALGTSETALYSNRELTIMSDDASGIIKFATGGNTEACRIDASGNLLMGTTTGADLGTVNEGILLRADGGSDYYIQVANNGTATYGVAYFYNGNGLVGSIQTVNSSTQYNTSSDYRLKEDVQPMVGASERLLALNPVNFAWKADGSRVDGFLAHEAQAVVPEAVTGTKDAVDADGNPVYQGIDQSKLVPLLTAALQEALNKIDDLESRVAALEAK